MNKGKSSGNEFFVRSSAEGVTQKSYTKSIREQTDSLDQDHETSEKSTPIQAKRRNKSAFKSTHDSVESKRKARTAYTNGSEVESDNEYPPQTSSSRRSAFADKSRTKVAKGRPATSASGRSSHSERSQRSFSTENDTDDGDVERRGDYQNNNDIEEESDTESSVRQTSPIRKKTSADLLAEESSQLLLSQGINTNRNIWNVLMFEHPKHKSKEDLETMSKLTFYPSSSPANSEDKLTDDVESRVAEDEGIYVGEPLKLPARNLNRLESRLLKEKSLNWFGSDGKLLGLPDPYRSEPTKLYPNIHKQAEFQKNVTFVPARLDPFQELQIDPRQSYEMVLELGTMHFTHHPLFSKEHVLCARLEEAFAEYTTRNLMRLTERATNKLKALREAISHTKQTCKHLTEQLEGSYEDATEGKMLEENITNLRQRIRNYRQEMQTNSLERDQGYWDDRSTLVSVLELWRELKTLRLEQGYTNTVVQLSIVELPVELKADKLAWQKAVEEEFNDLKEEHDERYDNEMISYNKELKKWLEDRRNQKKQKSYISEDGRQTTQESKSDSDDDTTIEETLKKPKPPPKFDADSTMKIIEKRHGDLRRQPGEPVLQLGLLKTATITATNQLPNGSNKEEQRRKLVQKLKVEIKIWFNDKEVYQSQPKAMQADFSSFLGLSIPISIKEWPESLEVEIIDSGTKIRADNICIVLPESKTTIDRCHTRRLPFTVEGMIKTSNSGVGSGVPFEIMGKEFTPQYSRGFLSSRIGWSTDLDGNILCPVGLEALQKQSVEQTGFNKPKNLMKGKVDLDPNDPRNAQWLGMKVRKLNNMPSSHPSDNDATTRQMAHIENAEDVDDGFALDDEMKEFDFCTMESIEKSLRFRLLRLRDDEVPEFRGLKMIPVFERDIRSDIFNQYERRLKEDMRKRTGADTSLLKPSRKKILDDESLYESNRLEKIREMRLSVLQLFENSTKQITFEDLVIEEQIPDIGTLGLNLMALFQPRRPLRPTRKERKRVQGSNLVDTKINLIVNIVRAFNLPMRKDTEVGLLTTEALTGIQISSKRHDRGVGNYATVKPFVEVWFQRNVSRTTTALGSNPTWNQELQLNLTVPNDDFSQANLSRMDDLVYFHVYDEVAIDLLEDDRRRETDIHQRLEKRWLGTISIPFSTLYSNGRIEGTFKLNSPPILLGYETQGMASHFGPALVGKSGHNVSIFGKHQSHGIPFTNQKNAFITIFITMQPSVTLSSGLREDSQSGETADMVAHVKTWKNSYEARFPDRTIKPFVMTSEGDTILCTRYLRPMEPPRGLLVSDADLLRSMEDLAHYVSLFPCVRDSTLGIVEYSLWFNSDIFIAAPGGGIDDHSVLLTCFFMYLNVPCWIIQGNAIPDGPTTFVLTSFKGLSEDKHISTQMKNTVLIWNACTGDYYFANDNFCPLQKIWAAIGKLNVWAYVGEGERPHQVDWDIGKSKSWLPLFAKPVAESKIPCIQMATNRYKSSDQVQANSLAQRIERHLKEVFMKWRITSKTHWNRYCSATLRRLLPRLEESKVGRVKSLDLGATAESSATLQSGSSTISLGEEHLIELREIMTSYQMTGFPLQQPYTNMESIIETVYATGVHTIDAPDVEFAVAAYAHAYPASVYSVWVYVAALHRRK